MTETSISNSYAMEFQSSILVIAALLSSLLLLIANKIHKQKTFQGRRITGVHKLPPGPWKLPIIGNLHQLAAAGPLPHRALRDLALEYGPIMHLQMGEISTIVVSSPALAKDILKTHDLTFVERPNFLFAKILAYGATDISFAPHGEYWRQMRKICTLELMSAKRVKSYSFLREDEVAKLIESIHHHFSRGSSPFNLSKSIFSLTNALASRATFGNKSKHEDEFLSVIEKTFELVGGFDVTELFPSWKSLHLVTRINSKLKDAHKKMDKILDSIVKEHRSINHDDNGETVVDVLLRIQQKDELKFQITDDNIKAVIWDMILAGSDSSGIVIEWAMSEMMKNPRVMQKVQTEIREAFKGNKTINESDLQELTYFKLVIKETLRLHPPGSLLLPRVCREQCEIGGYEIPIKTRVLVNAWAINRDPDHWYDPEMFIPERFEDTSVDFKGTNFEYLPFGAGRRICPGLLLGIANVELALASLLYYFNWELPDGMKAEDLDMSEIFKTVVGKKNNLYLIPSPYNYAS